MTPLAPRPASRRVVAAPRRCVASCAGIRILSQGLAKPCFSELSVLPMAVEETEDAEKMGFLAAIRDNNLFRDFFLDVRETFCYQRVEDARPRVCVLAVCSEAVLHAAHGDSKLAGHPGVDRTTAAVSHAFYWPGLHADVAHFARTCNTCAASKSSHHQRLGTETYSAIPIQPFTSWAMDLIGPMRHGLDWTNATIQGWQRVDRDTGGPYIKNNRSSSGSTQTYIGQGPG